MKKETSSSQKSFFKKQWSNILFVLFLAYMIFVPQNPVRIWLTKAVGLVRTQVESFELDEAEQYVLQNKDWEWQLLDMNNQIHTLKEFKGKPILINVWATWCPPCVAELPSLEKLYKARGNEVFFIFLAEDEPSKVQNFLKQRKLEIPVFFAVTPRPPMLKSSSIPTTFILDKNGVIKVRKTGAMDWNTEKIKDLLKKYVQ